MAEESIPVPSLSETAQSEAVAPNSLGGWSFFQHQVNVTLPAAIREAERVLRRADAILAGGG